MEAALIQALVDDSVGAKFAGQLAGLAIALLATLGDVAGNPFALAFETADAFRPTKRFEVVDASLIGRELLRNVYRALVCLVALLAHEPFVRQA